MVPPRQRRTVLWVKGDWRHRRALQRHLEKLDFSVIEVAHGRGAIQRHSLPRRSWVQSAPF